MAMDSVQQLQAMNQMMKGQLNQYEVQSAMILGIAGCSVRISLGGIYDIRWVATGSTILCGTPKG